MIVFELSRYILVPIFLDWLTPNDFIKFDSADCNKVTRSCLLDLISSYPKKFQQFVFSRFRVVPLSMKMFDWCLQRNFCFVELFGSTSLEVLNTDKNSLRSLSIENKNKLSNILNSVLSLSLINCSPFNLKAILKDCEKVESIRIEFHSTSYDFDPIMNNITQFCKVLSTLNISYGTDISEASVVSILHFCKSLTSLDVTHCEQLSTVFVNALVVHGRQLQCLYLHNSVSADEAQIFFIQGGHNLKELSYNNFGYVTIRCTMWYIGAKLTKLELLNGKQQRCTTQLNSFRWSNYISDVVDACPLLSHVEMSPGCTEPVSLQQLSISLPNLQRISSLCLHNMTESELQQFASAFPSLTKVGFAHCQDPKLLLHTVNMLSIVDTLMLVNTACDVSTWVTVFIHCRCLTHLDISGNEGLLDSTLAAIVPHLQQLKVLEVGGCWNLTDLALVALSHCTTLTSLTLSGNRKIRFFEEPVVTMFTSLSQLTKLDVSSTCIGLDMVRAMRTYCHQLKYLNALFCENINETFLYDIVRDVKKLRALYTSVKVDVNVVNGINKNLSVISV